jgi:hypothetical protein
MQVSFHKAALQSTAPCAGAVTRKGAELVSGEADGLRYMSAGCIHKLYQSNVKVPVIRSHWATVDQAFRYTT